MHVTCSRDERHHFEPAPHRNMSAPARRSRLPPVRACQGFFGSAPPSGPPSASCLLKAPPACLPGGGPLKRRPTKAGPLNAADRRHPPFAAVTKRLGFVLNEVLPSIYSIISGHMAVIAEHASPPLRQRVQRASKSRTGN